jgi:hypothetical protein
MPLIWLPHSAESRRQSGRGILTPEEGQAVGAVLEMQRKALELAELEERIAAL